MSSLYNLEPQPTAKVVLRTTAGDLELELFAKQTPLASRNFLQLCLDGYYDNTIFHRLVPGFIVQGGDPTGTGQGGLSSYDGEPFADEFHSRLKYNRRGLLGMANSGTKNDNGSQFFFTLGATPELAGTNTMFGRVAGDTIYNLMKIGEADLTEEEGSERPLYPTKITGAEVIVNPFEDMVKRVAVAPRTKEDKGPKKTKRKAAKQLLSFGDEEGVADSIAPVVKKPKFNPKLVSAGEAAPEDLNNTAIPAPPMKKTVPPPKKPPAPRPAPSKPESRGPSPSPTPSPEPEEKTDDMLAKMNAQIDAMKNSLKRTVQTNTAPATKKSALENMIPETAVRGRKRKAGQARDEAFDVINAFRSQLEEGAPKATAGAEKNGTGKAAARGSAQPNGNSGEKKEDAGGGDEELCELHYVPNCQSCKKWDDGDLDQAEEDEDDDDNWVGHALTFEKDRLGKDLEWKRKNEEELVVIDPREKAREIREEKKGRRKDTEREDSRRKEDTRR
ncbi:cyclophilin-like protein [Saccharata proteae CBS 121410]|uniref:Cyclophilin-like protein n=1 Tax=Saccharata proteae CBS 121410 TaxID=1314787 RepID=A0A9P4LXD4_9PEZI|nr:cyclophilin-like protein [Saccharata proteae CBS 121410]